MFSLKYSGLFPILKFHQLSDLRLKDDLFSDDFLRLLPLLLIFIAKSFDDGF